MYFVETNEDGIVMESDDKDPQQIFKVIFSSGPEIVVFRF